ncbi:ATP-dependent metallopeptidase FtsH/Yme1/Tma family protein [Ectothiorhodospiraceae bacterium WFHF3C12]|nr:ATP-dependent metallopeptidase FtsH/Yme1/Tma family protein [Ectothiorhodospiraceae bacterium WFHF3C12]
MLLWIAAVMVIGFYWMETARDAAVQDITYTQFRQAVQQERVAEVTIEGQSVQGLYREGRVGDGERASRQFETTLPPFDDPALMELLESHGVAVSARPTQPAWWQRLLVNVLPWVLILGVILYFTYRMQQRMASGGQGGLFGFGRSRARRFREESTGVTMDDVAGAQGAKTDLGEVIDYLRRPEAYRRLGAKIPRGVLMMGPPGTGKTLLAKAVAGEAGVPFYSISGSEFIEMFVGVGAARVRDMFKDAKAESPAIIFIDELDSIGRARGAGLGGGHDEREQTLNQILSEMDGFDPAETVVVLAATNRPDVLDPALLRPGRFDRKVTLDRPGREARVAILKVHAQDKPLADDVDLNIVAQRAIGFAGADLENLVNEAALMAGRLSRDRIDMECFTLARDRIVLGDKRDETLSETEKRVIAYHESGHALMAWLLPNADPLDKITIIPRGRALGATEQRPPEDRYNMTESYLRDRIGVMLGGRLAEQLIFGEVSTGSEADLKQATDLARRMVSQWGMSGEIGPSSFPRGESQPFLGREIASNPEFSEQTAELIDREIRSLLDGIAEDGAKRLSQHKAQLEALAERLLEVETLDASGIEQTFMKAA